MTTKAPHARMVTVRELSTGRVFETWPVDARELVATKEYEYQAEGTPLSASTATADTSIAAATPPSPAVTAVTPIPDQLRERSYKELQALAKRAGLNANQKLDDLIAALVPHVEAKAITLESVPSLALPSAQFPNAAEA